MRSKVWMSSSTGCLAQQDQLGFTLGDLASVANVEKHEVATDVMKMLNDLSAASDEIIEENIVFAPPCLKKWLSIVNQKAKSIVEGEDSTNRESGEMESLLSYLKGSTAKGPRVSAVLTEVHRMHLHRKRERSSQRFKSLQETPLRTSLRQNSNATETSLDAENTPKFIFPPTVNEKVEIISFQSSSNPHLFTAEKGTMNKKRVDIYKSSKRRSSSELSLENKNKKKTNKLNVSQNPTQRVQKIKKPMNSSLLPNIKSSVGAKKQDKAVENRKISMALRQKKLEETKRTREERMQKREREREAQTLRLKLETQKKEYQRSGKGDRTPISMQKIGQWRNQNGANGETSKKDLMKGSDKHPLPSKKTPQKNPKNFLETEKTINTTYIAFGGEKPSTNPNIYKAQTLKNLGTLSAKDLVAKTLTKTLSKGTKTVHQKQLINSAGTSTPMEKRGPESYAITPVLPTRSSFVCYDMSEIRSDSEEEEQCPNSKPIPSWAKGVRFRNALLQQHHHLVDTDELFGNVVGLPDLSEIFGVKKANYNKRTSSAVWNSSFSFS